MDNPWKNSADVIKQKSQDAGKKAAIDSEKTITSTQNTATVETTTHADNANPYKKNIQTTDADASDSSHPYKKPSKAKSSQKKARSSEPYKKNQPSKKPQKPLIRADQSARKMALTGLMKVFNGQSLSEVMPTILAQTLERDRGLTQELVYGTLRWGMHIKAIMKHLLDRPFQKRYQNVETIVMLGLYQLLHTRIPQHAAVSESVEMAKKTKVPWASGLVNGVMRRYQREAEQIEQMIKQESLSQYSHPFWLVELLQGAWPDTWASILEGNNARPPMTLRINTSNTSQAEYFNQLKAANLTARPHKYVKSAIILDKPTDVSKLPGFTQGKVSVQDAAAQLAAQLLNIQTNDCVLDACAAPGGKTGHMLEKVNGHVDMHVLDLDHKRLERVTENLTRLNYKATLHTGDAAKSEGDWAEKTYDKILLDVPCSATGVIRRHPDIKWHRKKQDIDKLVILQQQILVNIWRRLKVSGHLLYVTCSLLPQENDQQIIAFLDTHKNATEIALPKATWGQAKTHGRQTLPHEADMDGFYYCLLEKTND